MAQLQKGTYKVAEPKREYARRYYAEHRDEVLMRTHEYQAQPEVRERRLVYGREYRQKHSERLAQHSKAAKQRIRDEMIGAYGSFCACCGESDRRFLTLDHVNRDGARHMRQLVHGCRSQFAVLCDLKRRGWPTDGFRLLCMNCNWSTRYGQPCSHQSLVHLRMGTQEVYDG